MTYAEKVKEYFAGDKFVAGLNVVVAELSETQAVVKVQVKPEHFNANGAAQGGMLYTVADYTFALLANYLHPACVTQGGHIQYLRPVGLEEISVIARETARAGRNCTCEVLVKNAQDEIACVCLFNGFIKDMGDKNSI
jgi:acyl-CoA thioesterase